MFIIVILIHGMSKYTITPHFVATDVLYSGATSEIILYRKYKISVLSVLTLFYSVVAEVVCGYCVLCFDEMILRISRISKVMFILCTKNLSSLLLGGELI